MVSRRRAFAPPVAVLIPAHNEAHQISATLKAVNAAAKRYGGPVRVVVMENCSEDETARLAETTLAACEHIASFVVDASTIPGKAKALNRGLDLIDEDFVVRIDADTEITDRAIHLAMRHFANDQVGAVGGLPMPHEGEGLLSKVRAIEVLLRHGFVQVSFGAFGGIFDLPGMFVIYRKGALDAAGGFTEGMNGEDTDITLAMASIGYRNVSEPRAKFFTETPDTLAFLREQRTRWFRSLYHVTAHNRSALFANGSVIGNVSLPFTLLNGARRAMMTPLLVRLLHFRRGVRPSPFRHRGGGRAGHALRAGDHRAGDLAAFRSFVGVAALHGLSLPALLLHARFDTFADLSGR